MSLANRAPGKSTVSTSHTTVRSSPPKRTAAPAARPRRLFAKEGGLKVIALEPLPMIQLRTVCSSLGFVEEHRDIVERFLKGLMEGSHFVRTRPEQAIKIIREHCSKGAEMN